MSLVYIVGISGAAILIIAWSVSLVRTLLAKRHTIDPVFTAIYFVASSILTLYSILIHDLVFAALNGVATLIALIELCAYFYFKAH